jgi:hypothetical protein
MRGRRQFAKVKIFLIINVAIQAHSWKMDTEIQVDPVPGNGATTGMAIKRSEHVMEFSLPQTPHIKVLLVGTAHISFNSVEEVQEVSVVPSSHTCLSCKGPAKASLSMRFYFQLALLSSARVSRAERLRAYRMIGWAMVL